MREDDPVKVPGEDALQRRADGGPVPHCQAKAAGGRGAAQDAQQLRREAGGPGAVGGDVEEEVGQDEGPTRPVEEIDLVIHRAAAE